MFTHTPSTDHFLKVTGRFTVSKMLQQINNDKIISTNNCSNYKVLNNTEITSVKMSQKNTHQMTYMTNFGYINDHNTEKVGAIWIVIDLCQDIMPINIVTKFYEDWTKPINLKSRHFLTSPTHNMCNSILNKSRRIQFNYQ